jgi:DNA invertase Pin-like site-specific DNA recombinase
LVSAVCKRPWHDIASGKLTCHIFALLAEFERQLIQEWMQAGLKAARARRRLGGRPKALQPARQ